ncbi:MAG TPA: glycosyltransferase family 4 protein [Thermoanaerobaculia bacterium]|nr:glycosyltransferase family 4 protein [Thermoanaerobaculia bacterium]
MRILQALEFNQFNTGSVHQMFQAAAGLRERGHEVAIASRPDPVLAAKAAESGIDFQALPFRNSFDLGTIFALRRLIAERRFDVIHAHKGVAHALALSATFGKPVGAFIVNRGVSFPLDRWNRGKYRTHRVDRIVTVCRQIKDVIVTSGRLPSDKVEVVYAGTDVALFDPTKWDPSAFRREKGIGEDRFLVAQVGVRDWKGWKELIAAIAAVAPSHPEIHLALVGCRNDGEKGDVTGFARESGIGDRVSPVEYRTDMPSVLAACDLVVDASWAGTGVTGTIREAMAMRKPVIATDCGGNRELVSTREVGWLIAPQDSGAIAGAIRDVMGGPDRRNAVAARAMDHVRRSFSKELRIGRLEDLYRSILARKRL